MTVTVELNGVHVPLVLDAAAIAAIAAALELDLRREPPSPFVSIVEAAEMLRVPRATIDGWLSAGRLSRVKAGRRTLLRRDELDAFLEQRAR
ncbi:MAG TPA: helix-turn-helix domain-containing protein [Gaiellaceae bacterium]|nr:helix-turn-helix domain-containing protein [Gaiellaceae bacterium]